MDNTVNPGENQGPPAYPISPTWAGDCNPPYPPDSGDQALSSAGNPVDGAQPPPPSYACTDTMVVTMDLTEQPSSIAGFDNKSIRRGFIQKVFGILAIQMIFTIGVICLIYFVPGINKGVQATAWPYGISSMLAFVTMIVLVCMGDLRRKWPVNFICLMIFTLFESIMLGTLMTYFSAQEILVALGIVLIIVAVMFGLGFQQKFDFTWCLGIVVILLFCMFMYGFLILIYPGYYAEMAYATLGAMLMSLLLLVDIQMIVGGNRKVAYDPEEYIFAALSIYLDIVYILIYILMIIAARK